ncbi:MAG: DEAD/DEAH box helicase [Candidatus Obscuribacterales bacterium]|nr:DEAD/DEAH box helicase [Candidatus Obscuribacterales bacterium]
MSFSELGLSKRTVIALESLGLVQPTEIQTKSIPEILAGRDLMASAETGSGKTAAYALPVIQGIKGTSEKLPRVLVLVPTRELAIQVFSEFERFANNCGMRGVTVYGGTGYDKQTRLLQRGVDVVVATPGRLVDHIARNNVDLSRVRTLVLDEADRMLDMGFMPAVRKIVALLSSRQQTLLFSATIDKSIEAAARVFLKDPVRVAVNTRQVEPVCIDQRIYHVAEEGKKDLLLDLIKDQPDMGSVIVFARTRSRVKRLKKQLRASNVMAEDLHGDVSQNKREETIARYRKGAFNVLVATDVAARGLDIPTISHVVNYDLPLSAQDYVHRIGRTGRAGRTGTALSFVSADQRYLVRDIEKVTGKRLVAVNSEKEAGSASSESGNQPQSQRPSSNHKPRSRYRPKNRRLKAKA